MTATTIDGRQYRTLRRAGWAAQAAAKHVRASMALAAAEADDLIRFRVVPDEDYRTEGSYRLDTEAETREAEQYELARLESGEWEVFGVRAYVPATCPHCSHVLDDQWYEVGSLWGIVVAAATDPYVRQVMIDLASEAGVL